MYKSCRLHTTFLQVGKSLLKNATTLLLELAWLLMIHQHTMYYIMDLTGGSTETP